jgi:hypothetical protein
LGARFIKLKAPIPPEILNQCRVLKKRWEQLSPLSLASANLVAETVRHPTRCDLRATISLKQTSSAAFARPHFLIEFENLRPSTATGYQPNGASLSHLVRLTSQEQHLARLVCDGCSNQEIADETGSSLETGGKASSLHLQQAGSAKSLPIDRADALSKYRDVPNSGFDSEPLRAGGCALDYRLVLVRLFCHGKI